MQLVLILEKGENFCMQLKDAERNDDSSSEWISQSPIAFNSNKSGSDRLHYFAYEYEP